LSFAYDVKMELCGAPLEGRFVKKAEAYGLLIFGRSFSPSNILLQTEHEGVAKSVEGLLYDLYGIRPAIKAAARADGHGLITLTVAEKKEALALFGSFGYDKKNVSLRINRANIENESAAAAFLRGAFLSCGTVVDPSKDYHLEFVTPFLNLSRDLAFLLTELGFEPKTVSRKGNNIVYFKDSGQIEDMLTLMGAAHQSLELMNVKVYKDLRNKANRVTNCETANIEKTVNASTSQVEAIKRLIRSRGLDTLPEDLREVAQLRLDNPDISLRELGELLRTPLSRSGVNHRLSRLMTLAKK
jgi:DNA-binding protein WhiA